MYDVFISYSHDDLDWVAEFTGRLERAGLRVARDEVFLKPGDVLVHAIEQAIRDSAHGILVFSPASVSSGWVRQEYAALMQRSIEEGNRFIPVVIGDVELPGFAAARSYTDFRNASAEEYDRLIATIGEALRPELDFYISYASADRLWAEWVGSQLAGAGYTFELHLWHVLPGDDITILAREDALQRAGRVLALCSAAYFGGGFTERDWTAVMAADSGKPRRLVPVWVEDIGGRQLPGLLRSLPPVKVFGVPEAEASRRLLAALAGDLSPEGVPAFPGPATPAGQDRQAGSRPRMPGSGRPGAWHAPSRNPDFTGREAVIVALRETLTRSSSRAVVVLQGTGGIGKTQLAIEYAHRFIADYDAVWFFDAEQPELIEGQFARLAGDLHVTADPQDAVAAVLAALRERDRWLLIFDNVEDPDHLSGFLPDGQGHVLATSRVGAWQEIGTLIPVEEFSRPESTAMLTVKVPALAPADADGVAEDLGDFPLALAQAVGILQSGFPAREFRHALARHATQVLSEGKPRSYQATHAASTLVALDKLTASHPKAATLLRLCSYLAPESVPSSWFPEPGRRDLPPPITGSGLPEGAWEASRAFGHIRDIGLGNVDQRGLRLHRLTQAIIRDCTAADQAAYRDAAIAILVGAAPEDSDAPASWPDWSWLIPHLMIVDDQQAPAEFRPVACAAVRYLLVSGQPKAALTLAQRLYGAWTTRLGADHSDTLTIAQHLVHATHDTGEYGKLLEFQQDILARRRRLLGEDHPDTLRSASDLAVILDSTGLQHDALPIAQDAYDRRRRVRGEDHPDTLNSAGILAGIFHDLGRYAEALALNQDAYGRRRRVLGDDHPDTLNSAGNLAGILHALGRYAEALALNQDAYGRSRRVLGDDHPGTPRSANNLAGTLHALGRHAEALTLRQDAYDWRRRVLGDDHPDTLNSANNVAGTLGALGRHAEALALNQDAYDRRRRVLGDDHPDTLHSAGNLADTLHDLGRYAEALALNQDAYGWRRRVMGDDHPDTLRVANNLAGTLGALSRHAEALSLRQDVYDRGRRVLGDDHPDTLRFAGNLAATLYQMGRRPEALRLRQEAYKRSRRVLGEDHPETLTLARDLAANLAGMGQRAASLRLLGKQPSKQPKKKKKR